MLRKLVQGVLVFSFLISVQAWAGNDPSIKGDLRGNIHNAMSKFIDNHTVNGKVYLYDSVKGNLLKLKFDNLHDGIVKKGGFYVSCADFVDQNNRKIDIDFLVVPKGNELLATQALIHSVDGSKRKYHLEEL